MYTCPFCGQRIEDSIESLIAHRQSGGECDQNMETAGKNS